MPGILRCQGSVLVLLLATCAAMSGCEPFDDTRIAAPRGSLGEEIYKIACERIAHDEYPDDVSGRQSDALCRGAAAPSTAPAGTRLRALAENRDRLVEALDRTLPASLEDELQTLLVSMLPFYDLPTELLPRNTRAIGGLLADLMEDEDVMQAFARISQRRGMRNPEYALGLARPVLAYPGLGDLSATMLSRVDDGGSLEGPFGDVLEAAALEMATAEPTDPDDPTLGHVRDLMLRTHESLGSDTPSYIVARDSRGLPVPATLDGSQGFVDLDTNGLADVDELGRFLDADGALLDPPTPFPTVDESSVSRDEFGRALTDGMDPLYVYHDVERSFIAGFLRDAAPLVDPADPFLVDLVYGMLPLLGPELAGTETYGSTELGYQGFDSSAAAIYDLVHAGAELLTHEETPDVLALGQLLLPEHEADVTSLIESGFFGDAVSDATPGADLAPGSELWDDMIAVVADMAKVDGMIEAVLRSLNDPRSKHLGQILAEMMRFRDIPALDPTDHNLVLADQYWDGAVDRTQPDNGTNQSIFQQTLSLIWELNGAQTCNKQGADMFAFGININWVVGGPFERCEMVDIANTTELFVQSILGRANIDVVLNLEGLLDWLEDNGFPALSLDHIMENESEITGFTRSPTPQALARFVYGPWNKWLDRLMERPRTIDGEPFIDPDEDDPNDDTDPDLVATRYPNRPILAWERMFTFCGDRLLDEGEPCADPTESVSFYEAMAPLLDAFETYDPRTGGRFLFGEFMGAVHEHYPTAANTMYQGTDPNGEHFARPEGAVTYEPILSELLADCAWEPAGSGRTCNVANAGRLLSRLSRVTKILDEVEVRPGVDGIDVLAATTERLVNPDLNPGLANRAGETTTTTNSGSRTLDYTPIYLLLDALNALDAAHETAPERTEKWLSARSRLIDALLETEPLGDDQFQLARRHLAGVANVGLGFAADQIALHETDGDLNEWAAALDDDLADVLSGAMPARLLRFLDTMNGEPEAQQAFLELAQYLVDPASPNEALENLILGAGDVLFLLDDDDTMIALLHALADALVRDATAAVDGTGSLSVEGSIVDEAISLLHQTSNVDTARSLNEVLANAVTHPNGEEETPLEVIVDVIAEVNRVSPNEGGPLEPDDHGAVMEQVVDFLADEERGFERVYDVVQNRVLP